jgi:hypothetical protein
MPRARGYPGFLALGLETIWGSKVAATKSLRILSETMTAQKLTAYDQALGSLHRRGPFPTKMKVSGNIVTNLQFEGLERLLRFAMGTWACNTGTTGVGKWTFTLADRVIGSANGKSLTLNVNRDFAMFAFPGCRPRGFEFLFEPGKIGQVTWDILGRNCSDGDTMDVPGAGGVAAFPTESPLLETQGILTLNSADVSAKVKKATLKLVRPYDEEGWPAMGATAGYLNEPEFTDRTEISGTIDTWFYDQTQYNLFVNSTDAVIDLTYTGGLIGVTAVHYLFEIAIPVSRFTPEAEPKVDSAGLLAVPLKFQGYQTGSTEPMTITVWNSNQTDFAAEE